MPPAQFLAVTRRLHLDSASEEEVEGVQELGSLLAEECPVRT